MMSILRSLLAVVALGGMLTGCGDRGDKDGSGKDQAGKADACLLDAKALDEVFGLLGKGSGYSNLETQDEQTKKVVSSSFGPGCDIQGGMKAAMPAIRGGKSSLAVDLIVISELKLSDLETKLGKPNKVEESSWGLSTPRLPMTVYCYKWYEDTQLMFCVLGRQAASSAKVMELRIRHKCD